MRMWKLLSLALSLTFLAPWAHAYDEDTHFYGTYSMARFAGIDQSVALKIALSAQWMDECFLSDPTSMILLPLDGVKKRRLLHFPSIRLANKFATGTQDESFGFSYYGVYKKIGDLLMRTYNLDATRVIWHSTTVPNDPFASGLMREALREGNLMKAGASIHTLEDSYAHAGTSAEVGHTAFWHWPDRPFETPLTIQK